MRTLKTIVMVCACSLAVVPAAWSTTLSLGSASPAAPGSSVLLPFSLSSSGSLVSGAEWTFTYSTSDFVALTLAAGSAATAAAKNLACNSLSAGQYTCLLTGLNQDVISDGVIANLVLTLSSSTQKASSAVAVTGPSTSDPSGNTLATAATGSTVTISQPGTTLSGLSCSPTSITVPNSSTCTVTLAGAAPSTGTAVALGYAGSGATMSVPSSVTVPAGATQTAFAAKAVNATTSATVTIAATLSGASSQFALTVAPATAPAPALSGVSCSPASITVPSSATCTVTLTGAAPSGGTAVALSYTGSGATMSVPPSVTVPASATQAPFSAQAVSASSSAKVTITATLNGASSNFALAVAPAAPAPTADTTPPTAPSGLTASAPSSSRTNLAWTASTDNVGVTVYLIERCLGSGCTNFVQIATTTGTTFANTGLQPRTMYCYRVRAKDAAGNLSPYSNVASAKTRWR